MSDDIIKRLREAIAEHPLSPIHGYAADIAALLDRLDKLAGEHAMMKSLLLSEQAEKREISAECDRLREDAERYRWLTDDHPKWETRERVSDIAFRISVSGKGHIDAAIDAARAAEQSDERRGK